MSTNAHCIDGTELARKPGHLQWKYIYLYLNCGADLELEDEGTQFEGLTQLE